MKTEWKAGDLAVHVDWVPGHYVPESHHRKFTLGPSLTLGHVYTVSAVSVGTDAAGKDNVGLHLEGVTNLLTNGTPAAWHSGFFRKVL